MTGSARAPRIAVLMDWLEHRLPPQEMATVARAVETGDERLKETVAWLRDFLDTTSKHRLEEPPPIVRQSLQQHFRRWSGAADQVPEATVVGDLLFDSRRDLSQAAVRSVGTDEADFHLAYRSTVGDLVLDISPTRDGYVRLEGQLLHNDGDLMAFTAELRTPSFTVRSVGGDDYGRFSFDEVPAAVGRLTVHNGELSITADVDLSGAR